MKFRVFILIVFIATACSKTRSNESEHSEMKNTEPVYEQKDKLIEAYKQNSTKLLKSFFQQWHEETINSRSEKHELTEIERAAYDVFESFYVPQQLKEIERGKARRNSKETKYLVMPSYIKIAKVESLNRDSILQRKLLALPGSYLREKLLRKIDGKYPSQAFPYLGRWIRSKEVDTLWNFNPNVDHYLQQTDNYVNIMGDFLGKKVNHDVGKFLVPSKESLNRVEFLTEYINIYPFDADGQWHLETLPIVYRITFDKKLVTAVVSYGLASETGETLLYKREGKWIIVDNRLTGVF